MTPDCPEATAMAFADEVQDKNIPRVFHLLMNFGSGRIQKGGGSSDANRRQIVRF
jgi:hypothetical protein